LDGYRLSSLRLITVLSSAAKNDGGAVEAKVTEYVTALPIAPGVIRTWFKLDPPTLLGSQKLDAMLERRYWDHPGAEIASIYEWNRKFLEISLCGGNDPLPRLNDFYVFDPISKSQYPRYRFPQKMLLPSGLTTNQFGWRGPPIALNRAPHTIRIAFIGASTTVAEHGFPFSYPEFVGQWLNIWARSQQIPVNFEIINAGREGIDSNDFVAVVRDELLPVDPDLVVYYEGSNQFWPTDFIEWPGGTFPAKPHLTFRQPSWIEIHSAVARRVALGFYLYTRGVEPKKPTEVIHWPNDLDEFDPDLSNSRLPVNLPTILKDMQAIKQILDGAHSQLVISSFVWLAYDGMRLELPRQKGIYDFLNDTYWPFTYAHIRRMADFQNRAFRKSAVLASLPFIDVAGEYPQDPDLFEDAIHMSEIGIKLQAWIVLQQLLPIIKERIATGALPRPLRNMPLTVHPAFIEPATLITKSELKLACPKQPELDRERLADVAAIRRVLDQYQEDKGHYPILPPGYSGWGQCGGGTRNNWLPDGNDYTWSKHYIEKMPTDPQTDCNYPFDPMHVGRTEYMYYTDGGHRYAIVVGLVDASLPGTLHSRGTEWLPQWFRTASGFDKQWWEGTYIVVGGE
jgi:hypothetical protein